jgi:transposase InsO family protein
MVRRDIGSDFAPFAEYGGQDGLCPLDRSLRDGRPLFSTLAAIATRAGWLCLAVLLDLYSRRVIGWAMSAKPNQQVALQALHIAVAHRRPRPGLVHHSDQGALYTSGPTSTCWPNRA